MKWNTLKKMLWIGLWNVAWIPLAAALPPPLYLRTPPSLQSALAQLYPLLKKTAQGQKVLPNGEVVTLYHSERYALPDGSTRWLMLFGRTHPQRTSRADSAEVDAVVFRLDDHKKWVFALKKKHLLNLGEYGELQPPSKELTQKREVHLVQEKMIGIFFPMGGGVHQGFFNDAIQIIGLADQEIRYLGFVETESNNEGNCQDPPPREDTLFGPCYAWIGKLEVSPVQNEGFATLTIKRKGTFAEYRPKGWMLMNATDEVYRMTPQGVYEVVQSK